MNKQRKRLLRRLRTSLLLFFALGGSAGLLSYRIATLTPQLFPAETSLLKMSQSLLYRPVSVLHLPLKILQLAVTRLPVGHAVLLARLPSALLGLCSIVALMYITKRWYGRRSMVVGCLLFVTSAWFLHASRFAGVEIEYLAGILTLLTIHVGLYDHSNSSWMLFGWLVVNLLLLTIPGFVWFVLLSLVWQSHGLLTAWQKLRPIYNRILLAIIGTLGVASILYSILRIPRLYWQWLGIPEHVTAWQLLPEHIGQLFVMLAYRGPTDGQAWIARAPIMDAFIVAAFIMGACFYAIHWRASRTHLIASYLLLGSILTGLHGGVPISIVIPLIYIVAVGGIAYVLYIWVRTFPRNQLARSVGIIGVALLVSVSCLYNLREYFVVWPKDPDTVRALSRQ